MKSPWLMALVVAFAIIPKTPAEDRPDIVVADFESETYAPWTATGESFGPGPAKGALPGQMAVGDYVGDRLVNSFFHGDDTEGTLNSPEFSIDRKYIHFLIGGGRHPGETGIRLIVDGNIVREQTGIDSEFLRRKSWDVAEFAGKMARLEIVDHRKGRWGHINIDQIVQADSLPTVPEERATLLAKADAADRVSAERAAKDPTRPIYHVVPPGNWLNDPNGPIYYRGYYHLFYQHNPYGDDWGNMHWGHARSKDLAHWEHLPTALWPSKDDGEEHVFSGCATLTADGKPIIFYTSIGNRLPEQWAAIPDGDDLISWKKHPANPVLTEKLHGDVKVHEWRDPFVFKANKQVYMVAGGNLNANKGGEAIVNVYRAQNGELTQWTYLGELFRHPDAQVQNIECPLFFPLEKKWVLIVSQGRPVQWFVGDLDLGTMKFKSERRGDLDAGNFYAPNVTEGKDGQTLLWGWIPDFPKGRGWNGCMTLPRVLKISPEGDLVATPAPELEALRGSRMADLKEIRLSGDSQIIDDIRGDAIEIHTQIDPKDSKASGIRVRRSSDGKHSIPIEFDGHFLSVAGTKIPARLAAGKTTLDLRIFLDRSVLEVYTDTGISVSRVITAEPEDLGFELFSRGGSATFPVLQAWAMESIWNRKP